MKRIFALFLLLGTVFISHAQTTPTAGVDAQLKKIIAAGKTAFKTLHSGAGDKDGNVTVFKSKVQLAGTESSVIKSDAETHVYIITVKSTATKEEAAQLMKQWSDELKDILPKETDEKTGFKNEDDYKEINETLTPENSSTITQVQLSKSHTGNSPWTVEIRIMGK